MQIIISPHERDLAEVRRRLGDLERAAGNLGRPLQRIGLFVRRAAARRLRGRRFEWGQSTGKLAGSLAVQADERAVTVGSNLVYAAIQQVGGRVLPKSGRYLALPVTRELRRSGAWPRDLPRKSLKYSPKESIRIGSHSWTGPALVQAEDSYRIVRTQRGERRVRTRKAGQVLFALVRKVTIRGRPYLAFDSESQRFALAEIERELRRVAQGGR
ncbi:MAG: phage virion morphogenesis protein [Phycisphaerae bacterium]